MAMSRRKQLHPKSMKEDQILFALPGELKYDEESNEIITRVDLEQDHQFGPFPAILKIEDRIESFHLLDRKHNWLVYCSLFNQSSSNLNLIFQNNQLIIMTKELIPSGTRIYSNRIIKDIQIKEEPIEANISPHVCLCDGCGIRFNNQNTLNAHRERYCIKQSHSTGVKRKSTDNSSIVPVKRLANEKYCSECDISFSKFDKTIPFTRPIQIGKFIYVPIPIVSSQPLNLSKPKKTNEIKIYHCEFCSISFRSFETLQAHQDNYCIPYQKQDKISSHSKPSEFLLKCTICSAMFNNEETLLDHIKCVHTNTNSIECLECQSRFCSKWNLIRHMKLLHTNIKYDELSDSINLITPKYSCPSCHIQFSQFHTLIQHMNNYCSTINNQKKSINYCSTCQIAFQHRTSYEAHKMFYCRHGRKTSD